MIEQTDQVVEKPLSPRVMVKQELDKFIANPGLAELASLFGVEELPAAPDERLYKLQEVAQKHWDFRKNKERQDVKSEDCLLDRPGSEQWNTIFRVADNLGLIENTQPRFRNPTWLVVLGGANNAPLYRLSYGLEQVEDFGMLVFLGSERPISDTEKVNVKEYAPNAQTEFDLGCDAFQCKLPGAKIIGNVKGELNGATWRVRTYEFQHNGKTKRGLVMSAPPQGGTNRATTSDNYKFFAEWAKLKDNPKNTVESVTTGFYTKGQHFVGLREVTLKYGVSIDTIGHSAKYSGGNRRPEQLLQEIKSAIDAAVKLHEAMEPVKVVV